jgi:peroxiredoxin
LRSFQERLSDFDSRGIDIVAISVDPSETTRTHVARIGCTYTFLSDPRAEVIRRYDLLHPGGGKEGDIARPAEFLIDPTGTVRWSDLTENYWVRARPETVLRSFDAIKVGSTAIVDPDQRDRR